MERVAVASKSAPGRTSKGTATASRAVSRRPPVDTIRTPLGAALPAALWSAAVGLAAVTVLVVLGWAAAPDGGTPPSIAVAAGGQAWLLVHGANLDLAAGSLSLTPLGLLLLPCYVLVRSGQWAARAADVRSWADAARTAGLLAVVYSSVGLAVALASVTPSVQPKPWSAVLCTGFIGVTAGGYGVLRGSGLLAQLPSTLPARVVPILRGALGAVSLMVAGGALVVAVSLVSHAGQVGRLWSVVGADPAGAGLLVLLSCALVPNAVLWACAYSVGPGFSVGVGTAVAPTGVVIGAVPSLPILGALPGAGAAPVASLLSLALPVLAGAFAGVLVARHPIAAQETPSRAALLATGAGALGGLTLGFLTALSAGALGGGRMAEVGPAGVQVGLVAGLEMAVVAGAVCWEWRRHVARRSAGLVDLSSQ